VGGLKHAPKGLTSRQRQCFWNSLYGILAIHEGSHEDKKKQIIIVMVKIFKALTGQAAVDGYCNI
jgi:hypothetical protein